MEYLCTGSCLFSRVNNVIADDIVSIDNAMKWGFGWKQGPFEVWDAIGVEQSVNKMKEQGLAVPTWIEEMLAKESLLLQGRK